MESKSILDPQPTDLELPSVERQRSEHRPAKPYRRFAWMAWTGWLVFAALLIVMLSRSLQPRMPGMPITGGTLNNGSSTTTNSDNSMPGMKMGK